ncbi:ABC transporter permease [Micrococcales bacterium 31B]|nr:ABC transporter permease [Micrococcales bacterium 31B]
MENNTSHARAGQARFVAPFDANTLGAVDTLRVSEVKSSFWRDAWRSLRRNPLFWISAAMIVLLLVVIIAPTLFTKQSPSNANCFLLNSLEGPRPGSPFGFDKQGCDVFVTTLYGARASVAVGIITTLIVTFVGGILGSLAGYYGGWMDAILGRVTDIFFGVPLILAAIVIGSVFRDKAGLTTVILSLALFGWPSIARVTRGAVLSVKNNEYIAASTSLGGSKFYTLMKHVIPNALGPLIVVATVSLGGFIVAEATLSFLGIGLPPDVRSWGAAISNAQSDINTNPSVLLYPSAALAFTVLAFLTLGDAVRDALDPKAKTR